MDLQNNAATLQTQEEHELAKQRMSGCRCHFIYASQCARGKRRVLSPVSPFISLHGHQFSFPHGDQHNHQFNEANEQGEDSKYIPDYQKTAKDTRIAKRCQRPNDDEGCHAAGKYRDISTDSLVFQIVAHTKERKASSRSNEVTEGQGRESSHSEPVRDRYPRQEKGDRRLREGRMLRRLVASFDIDQRVVSVIRAD